MKSVITNTIEETYKLADEFVNESINGGIILCLKGDLGSGKTTFTQGILKSFDVEGPYTSPTFNIIKEYDVDKHEIKIIYHIDAYRIGSDDMELIGWKDIVDDNKALIIIEWPENVQSILPSNVSVILCEMIDEKRHKYTFKS